MSQKNILRKQDNFNQYLKKNKLYIGDSVNLLESIKPNSISLSLWSPPYFVGKEYELDETLETWLKKLKKVINHHFKILKNGGFMVINIADIKCFQDQKIPKYSSNNLSGKKIPINKENIENLLKKDPSLNRYQIAKILGCSEQTIQRRMEGTNIRGGKYVNQTRVRLSGPDLERYAYDSGLFLYDRRIWKKDPSWINSRWISNTLKSIDEFEDLYIFWKPGETILDKNQFSRDEKIKWVDRAVWEIPSVRSNKDHPAKFPYELASRIIRLYSKVGDLVLDPFVGSGTSVFAAIDLNRDYIGIDKVRKYINKASQTLREKFNKEKPI